MKYTPFYLKNYQQLLDKGSGQEIFKNTQEEK
jgi:hypothetical protein